MNNSVSFTIFGQPCSKANSRRIVTNKKTGKPMVIKSPQALAYEAKAAHQAPKAMLTGELRFSANVYYKNQQPDLDISLLLDALQEKVYKNDRQIREMHIYHAIDKKNPRAEITVEPRGNPLFKSKA